LFVVAVLTLLSFIACYKPAHGLRHRIIVRVATQQLCLRRADGVVLRTYNISTSQFGEGSSPGSRKTPLGHFIIKDKIGDSAALGEIFHSRVATGRFGKDGDPSDFVETRIMWLSGLDRVNANTHDRYIYIHGTNSESKLGKRASFGCVRMSNKDVVDLFNRVPVGTLVDILR
jgi:lipoprotein-anchoring transpeptidase ErfK/SrfK